MRFIFIFIGSSLLFRSFFASNRYSVLPTAIIIIPEGKKLWSEALMRGHDELELKERACHDRVAATTVMI